MMLELQERKIAEQTNIQSIWIDNKKMGQSVASIMWPTPLPSRL
jgi:hypothetical protein